MIEREMAPTVRGHVDGPAISVIIATRDRGPAILGALSSIVASDRTDWELIIVDQSSTNDTQQAISRAYGHDPRIQYLKAPNGGLSAAHNVGIARARAPYLAFTDDDCAVADNWLSQIIGEFGSEPDVGFICGEFSPAPFEPGAGHIPNYCPEARKVISHPWPMPLCFGGNMAIRASVLPEVGFFDEQLGPGAMFACTGDQDMCQRVLMAGHDMLVAPGVKVVHHGLRTYAQLPAMWSRDGRGVGSALSKQLRCGSWRALMGLAEFWWLFISQILWQLVRWQRPFKIGMGRNYIRASAIAFVRSRKQPINRQHRVYLPQSWLASDGAIMVPRASHTERAEAAAQPSRSV